jgi:hypothetical protein
VARQICEALIGFDAEPCGQLEWLDEDDLYQELQEIRRFKPSTVSRRFSVTAGFYRTCVLDGLLQAAAP